MAARSRDYIARTIVPTHHYQRSLLRVPLPSLESTCESYLTNLRPLVSPEVHRRTVEAISAFQTGVGKDLHAELTALEPLLDLRRVLH